MNRRPQSAASRKRRYHRSREFRGTTSESDRRHENGGDQPAEGWPTGKAMGLDQTIRTRFDSAFPTRVRESVE